MKMVMMLITDVDNLIAEVVKMDISKEAHDDDGDGSGKDDDDDSGDDG